MIKRIAFPGQIILTFDLTDSTDEDGAGCIAALAVEQRINELGYVDISDPPHLAKMRVGFRLHIDDKNTV